MNIRYGIDLGPYTGRLTQNRLSGNPGNLPDIPVSVFFEPDGNRIVIGVKPKRKGKGVRKAYCSQQKELTGELIQD